MIERASHEMFVEALLALEDAVGAEEYAAYRRRLQQRLAEEPPVRPARLPHRRFPAKAHLAAAVLLLSFGIAFHSLRQATDASSAPTGPVVLSQRGIIHPQGRVELDENPYAAVVQSGLVALVCTERPFRQRGEDVFPLRIERVLKDETPQRPAQFCCAFQEETRPGERYLACISESKGKWVLNDIVRVDDRARPSYLPGAERCLQLLAASRCSDAATQYEALLAPAAGGMDEPASCVFACRPDPRSSSVLLSKLETLRNQMRTPNPTDDRGNLPVELGRVAEALERLNEPGAAVAAAECARLSPPGRRAGLYRLLPGLCVNASKAVRERVRRLLQDEIEQRGSDPDDSRAARAALQRESLAR